MEKCYCLSVRRVSYGREEGAGGAGGAGATHRLAVHDLRGAWTKLNRDLAFALIDTYIKTQVSWNVSLFLADCSGRRVRFFEGMGVLL